MAHLVTRSRLLLALVFAVVLTAVLWLWPARGTVNANFATRDVLLALPQMSGDLADRIVTLRPFADLADFEARLKPDPALLAIWRDRLDFDPNGGGDCCVR